MHRSIKDKAMNFSGETPKAQLSSKLNVAVEL